MDKIKITKSAIVQRINRRLAHDRQYLKKARGNNRLNDWYVLENNIILTGFDDKDLISFAEEKDCFHPTFEELSLGEKS